MTSGEYLSWRRAGYSLDSALVSLGVGVAVPLSICGVLFARSARPFTGVEVMSDDIVERLYDLYHEGRGDEMCVAADTITSLRAEVADNKKWLKEYSERLAEHIDTIRDRDAKIETLQEQLREHEQRESDNAYERRTHD